MIFTKDQDEKLKELMSTYQGDATVLASAVGAFTIGRLYGWRVLRLLYSSATYTKYQKLLKVDFKLECPKTTELSERSRGYKFVVGAGKFWDFVRGRALPSDYLDIKKELA